jgi:branched-chain amino acid transport system ATP-binding protein
MTVTTEADAALSVVLATRDMSVGYGKIAVVHDFSIEIGTGEVVALLGANGAGKTTALAGIVGELPLLSGQVEFDGRLIRGPIHKRARAGIGFVSGEGSIFPGLSVMQNLALGPGRPDLALDVFPELRPLLRRRAGLLSGGEQQMLTVGRAIAARPRVLVVDEVSLGLAPLIARRLLQALRDAAKELHLSALVVEQTIPLALAMCDRAYVLRRGRIELAGPASDLRGRTADIRRMYLP